jgi:hypothetical protein
MFYVQIYLPPSALVFLAGSSLARLGSGKVSIWEEYLSAQSIFYDEF